MYTTVDELYNDKEGGTVEWWNGSRTLHIWGTNKQGYEIRQLCSTWTLLGQGISNQLSGKHDWVK